LREKERALVEAEETAKAIRANRQTSTIIGALAGAGSGFPTSALAASVPEAQAEERLTKARVARTLASLDAAGAELRYAKILQDIKASEGAATNGRSDLTSATDRGTRAIVAQTAALEAANPAIEQSIRNLEMLSKRNADLTVNPVQAAMAERRRLMSEAMAGGLADVIAATDMLTDMEVARVQAITAANVQLQRMPSHIVESVGPLEALRQRFEDVEMATGQIRWAIDDVARAIADKDWAGVFSGLIRTLQNVKELWNSGQPGARSSAAGAVLGSVGGMVGGRAGGVISGIGSGFSAAGAASAMGGAIGTMAGPIGVAIAGFTILNKVLSDDKAAKRAKREQEANDIQRATAIAQERANKRAELEIALLRAQGDELAAVTREREAELATLDSVSAAIQRQIYALNDWKKTVADAEAAVSQAEANLRRAYEIEADRLRGIIGAVEDARRALNDAYQAEVGRLRGIIGAVDQARAALNEAYQRERSAIEATISGVESLIAGLRAFRGELTLNPLAGALPGQGREAALGQFRNASAADAPQAGRTFLDASMGSARTMAEFQRDRALVARAIDEMVATSEAQLSDADRQLVALDKQVAGLIAANDNLLSVEAAIRLLQTAEQDAAQAQAQLSALEAQVAGLVGVSGGLLSVDQAVRNLLSAEQAAAQAEAQLAALDAQVGALINLNASFMSVAQAIAALASAQEALAAAQAARPDTSASPAAAAFQIVGAAGYVDQNPDLAALFASGTGMARGRSKEEFGLYHWQRYGQGEDRFYRPFANGGAFAGGMVNGPTAFNMGVMGEAGPEAIMPLANVGGQLGVRAANDGLVDEVRGLRAEMAALRAASERTARASEDSRDVLEGSARGDLPLRTEAA
jgi:hypothetical protein